MTAASDLQVLLVEDSPIICNLIGQVINDVAGVALAQSVDSEPDAIEAVLRGNIDVVILDLQLRTGTGFGVLRAMRKMDRKPVVVVFTNFAQTSYRDLALSLGARVVLDKSRDYDRLPELLTELATPRTS